MLKKMAAIMTVGVKVVLCCAWWLLSFGQLRCDIDIVWFIDITLYYKTEIKLFNR